MYNWLRKRENETTKLRIKITEMDAEMEEDAVVAEIEIHAETLQKQSKYALIGIGMFELILIIALGFMIYRI